MAVLGCRSLGLVKLLITSRPHLLNFLLGTGNKVLISVGLMSDQSDAKSDRASLPWPDPLLRRVLLLTKRRLVITPCVEEETDLMLS